MTDMMRTFNRATEAGVNPQMNGNKLMWTTLNGEFRVVSIFNNNGEFVDSTTIKVK